VTLRAVRCRGCAADRGLYHRRIDRASAVLLPAATVAACATVPREPLILPTVAETCAAFYDAVWEAALKNLGAVKPVVAGKAQGRIESDVFSFRFGFGDDAAQTLWVSLAITVSRTDAQHTTVQVQTRVHDMLLTGPLPGPLHNPWVDLFARIRSHLGLR
jgi:hypothetical protein